MDRGTLIILSLTILTAFGLLAAAAFVRDGEQLTDWPGTDIACVAEPEALEQATSSQVTLSVSFAGEEQTIPAGIGVSEECVAPLHTTDASGRLQFYPQFAEQPLSFADFLAIGGVALSQQGFRLEARVNDEVVSDIGAHRLQDGDRIELLYVPRATTSTRTLPPGEGASSAETPAEEPLNLDLPASDGPIEVVE